MVEVHGGKATLCAGVARPSWRTDLANALSIAVGDPRRPRTSPASARRACLSVTGSAPCLQWWIAADAHNAEVLFPFLNGEDLNSRPDCSPSRWVIDFNDRSEAESARYEVPFLRALERVKPERMTNNRAIRRERWWQYGENAPGLRKAIVDLAEVLVITRHSKAVMPMRASTAQVFSEACVVFATDSYSVQAVLSSSLHQLWAITYGSGLRNDPRYTPSDVFETFPQVKPTAALDQIGRMLHDERSTVMRCRNLGLTRLYNLVNDPAIRDSSDPDIARLRELHQKLDAAVLDAYGWADIDTDHGFYDYRRMVRWSVCASARVEILDRLLEENRRRAQTEQSAGFSKRSGGTTQAEGTLFG